MKNEKTALLKLKTSSNSRVAVEVFTETLNLNHIVVPTSDIRYDSKTETYFMYLTIVPKQPQENTN